MKAQQIFNKVVNGLRKQGCKSESAPGSCRYRGPNKTRCSAGLLMSNKEFAPWMEGKTIDSVITNESCSTSLKKKIGPNHQLVARLQEIHDHHAVSDWELLFRKTAQAHNLVYTAPSGA
jgi:mRNA-degrading endonuclease YafQ of YafQ-DinJ toxin-antitoxin module